MVKPVNTLKGIHGWLRVYVTLMGLGFASAFLLIIFDFSAINFLVSVTNIVILFFLLELTVKEKKQAKKWNIILLSISAIFNLIIFFPLLIINIAWIIYWSTSKRVKNTFIK